VPTLKKNTYPGSGRAEFDYLDPSELRFDPNNPRFGGNLSGKKEDEIEEFLIAKPYYAGELIDSFLENGFIDYEPLIVREDNGSFLVLEGNRRLAAVKHILRNRNRYETPENKKKIDSLTRVPVLKFSQGGNQEVNERIYLGLRHLLGYREWPPLSKAKFLNREIKSVGDVDRVVREIGITKSDIQRYLVPYRVLLKTNSDIPEGEDFWLLGEALSRSGIKKYVELDVDRKTIEVKHVRNRRVAHLLDFLYGKYNKSKKTRDPSTARISDTRQLSSLAKTLNSDEASAALERGSDLQLALMFVETKEENVRRLNRLLDEISSLLKDAFKLKSRVPGEKAVADAFKTFESAVKSYLAHADSDV
jgi:ParB-like nuclease family protein